MTEPQRCEAEYSPPYADCERPADGWRSVRLAYFPPVFLPGNLCKLHRYIGTAYGDSMSAPRKLDKYARLLPRRADELWTLTVALRELAYRLALWPGPHPPYPLPDPPWYAALQPQTPAPDRDASTALATETPHTYSAPDPSYAIAHSCYG